PFALCPLPHAAKLYTALRIGIYLILDFAIPGGYIQRCFSGNRWRRNKVFLSIIPSKSVSSNQQQGLE
ncbi:MAG: hypothetical protein KDG51_22685, partial [Calditrichaeota bacterium]|nr:hypothetical protein [Calditrichota bacterium]